jgi:hypothetical protein
MTLRRRTTMACGALLLAMTAAAVPASAQPLEREHFEESGTGVIDDFCGAGIAVQFDFTVWGSFLLRPIGPDGLAYGQESVHLTNTLTNLATGSSVTHVLDYLSKDLKVTDNGDGTLTIRVVEQAGGDRWFSDGKLVIVDSGGLWLDVLVDDGGTPTDPSDDEVIDTTAYLKETGQELNLTDDNFCDEILAIIG